MVQANFQRKAEIESPCLHYICVQFWDHRKKIQSSEKVLGYYETPQASPTLERRDIESDVTYLLMILRMRYLLR